MSTPINTLPLKTQQSNISETNDINDPLVQDVLNEFQEELMISKQHAPQSQHMHQPPPMMPPQQQYHNQQYQQQHSNYKNNLNKSDYSTYLDTEVAKKSLILVIISLSSEERLKHQQGLSDMREFQKQQSQQPQDSQQPQLQAELTNNSGIINTVYEKLPDYLQDNLNNFDIYIKSLSLFAIIYVLSFFEYI